jgi:hypothetical protein
MITSTKSVGVKGSKMTKKRKAIPQDIKDKLLVDSMHRCCLCPQHEDITEFHHIELISEEGLIQKITSWLSAEPAMTRYIGYGECTHPSNLRCTKKDGSNCVL